MTIEPHIHSLLHSLKRDADPSVPQCRFQIEDTPIRANRIVLRLRKLPLLLSKSGFGRSSILMTLPWIHGIDIVNPVKTSQFHMSWHLDGSKSGYICVFPVKIRRTPCRILRPCKLPGSIETLTQTFFLFLIRFLSVKKMMIRMGLYLSHPKHLRVIQPRQIRGFLFLVQFLVLQSHLTLSFF